jgi:four helix bundle protein
MTHPSDSPELLAHERLDAFQVAMALDGLVADLTRRMPRGHAWLVDQLQRAAGSAVLNLVEANGRVGADRLQHLRIAKGSALEADAALGLLEHRRLIRPEERAKAHSMTVHLVKMLTGLGRVSSSR